MQKENLILPFSSGRWYCFSPPDTQGAVFSLSDDEARIATPEGRFALGKWLFDVALEGGAFYDFSVTCRTECDVCDVYVILTQRRADGKMPIREHAHTAVRTGEYILFSDKVETDPETTQLTVELWLKGKGVRAHFGNPTLTPSEPPLPRRVRVAPVQIKTLGKTKEEQYTCLLDTVDAVCRAHPDIVILGEGAYGRGLGLSLGALSEDETSEMPLALRQKAKMYHSYIVYNTVEEENGTFYNTSYLFGRDGGVVGKYRKTHLPVTEYEQGFAPGDTFPVFDLDFGRVGLLICYDQFFPVAAEQLAMQGAELICICTAGDAHHCSFARAMENGIYLAISGMNNENSYGWGATRVVDPLGRVLAQTDENLTAAVADVDLGRRVRRYWMSTGPAMSDVHDDYLYEKNTHLPCGRCTAI